MYMIEIRFGLACGRACVRWRWLADSELQSKLETVEWIERVALYLFHQWTSFSSPAIISLVLTREISAYLFASRPVPFHPGPLFLPCLLCLCPIFSPPLFLSRLL